MGCGFAALRCLRMRKPPKILLVEDNLLTKKTIGLFLRDEGYEVDEVEDGMRALLRLKEAEYDLIVSDIAMPKLNGLDLLERARSISPRTPVVLMTECSMSDNVAVAHPEIDFVRPCNLCPHMKRITLANIRSALEENRHVVTIDPRAADPARRAVERMLAI
jgi:CheY-like chemotaxis protein